MPVIAIAKEANVFSSAEFSIGEKKGVQKGVWITSAFWGVVDWG
jgi:hypothetical protein